VWLSTSKHEERIMGQEQLNRVGSHGRDDIGKLYGCQVIGAWQPEHFLAGKVPPERYDVEDPEMQGLIDSIKAHGWMQPGEVWFFEDTQTSHVLFGNRRTYATEVINQERNEAEQDPIIGRYKIVIKKAMTPAVIADALARYSDENNRRKPNDWMTIANAAAQELAIGVDVGLVLSHWPMIHSEALLERLTKDNGVRAAIPELQTALASGKIKLSRALKIADLPLDQQLAAMTAPLRQKREGGPVSPVKVRKAGQTFADTAKAHGIPGLDLAGIGAVLRYIGGDRTALDGMRQVKALIVESIGEKAEAQTSD
jgi:hypothetical protein